MQNAFFGHLIRSAVALSAAVAASTCLAGTFGVAPLKLELGTKVHTAVITVSNEGTEVLQLEVNPVAWTMDEAGTEQYTPTEDLAVFPQGLTIPPGQKRVVRVGIETPPAEGEKTYRVFLKEQKNEGPAGKPRSAHVSMLVNFGVPVFVSGGEVKAALQGKAVASKKSVELALHNGGTSRARIEGISLSGQTKEYVSPYVLAGRDRTLSFPLNAADCARGRTQEVQLQLHDDTLVKLPVDLSAACP